MNLNGNLRIIFLSICLFASGASQSHASTKSEEIMHEVEFSSEEIVQGKQYPLKDFSFVQQIYIFSGLMSLLSLQTVYDVCTLGGREAGLRLAEYFRIRKNQDQYRYLARPIYMAFGGRSYTFIATPASFFLTDLIAHQVGTWLIYNFVNHNLAFENYEEFYYFWPLGLSWTLLSLPVIYSHITH